MFAGWGSWVARFRWPVLGVALVAVLGAGIWGLGVFGQLTEGGYNDPDSESTRAAQTAQEAFGARGGDLVVIYTPTGDATIDDPALATRIQDRLAALPASAATVQSSYWSTQSPQFAARDRSSAIALITLVGADDGAQMDAYREIDDKFAVDGASVQLSGGVVLADASSTRSTDDLAQAEIISLPIVLVLLVLIFGSLVAAAVPVLVGGAAVLGSLGILQGITYVHDVNSFAVNVASLLGLGMAIDYGLFMVGRFREELAEGRTPAEAVRRTVGTAGRTVLFSASLLMIALGGLLLFPQGFLKSLAYGGLASVFLAAVLSLTLLPALLAVLGPRIDKIPVRLPRRRTPVAEGRGWTRLAGFVLRRPLLVTIPILAALLLLAAPVRGVHFGEADERMLPAGDPARAAIETLKADYPQFTGDGVQIVLRGTGDPAGYAAAARRVEGVAQLGPAEQAGDVTTFTATLTTADPFGDEARRVVERLRALPVPAGSELLIGGTTARNVDSLDATADKLPLMVALLVGATLLLMFLAFGSILLPIKAVVMSALSLCATFGVLVWIFQEGHGASWLGVTPAPLEVGIVVLMAAVVFGLSTDYEVFLLSRMVEARTRGASTEEAVTTGLTRTGRVISAAALLLIVVTGAFALSSITTMRFVGVGMILALLLDATVVRMLLVPAVLRLMGDAAWWAPGPLRRLQERAGLAEHAAPPDSPDSPDSPAEKSSAAAETAVLMYNGRIALPAGPARPDPALDTAGNESPDAAVVRPARATPLALPAGPSADTAVLPLVTVGTPATATATADTTAHGIVSDETDAAHGTGITEATRAADNADTAPETGIVEETDDGTDVVDAAIATADTPGTWPTGHGQPTVYTSASSADYAEPSAPEEFFFAPSGSIYGAPIEPPAVEAPRPWELPVNEAGASDVPGTPDVSSFETTRTLTPADIDAARVAPDSLDGTSDATVPADLGNPVATAAPGTDPAANSGEPAESGIDAPDPVEDDSDLEVTRHLEAPDLDTSVVFAAPVQPSTRSLPGPDPRRVVWTEAEARSAENQSVGPAVASTVPVDGPTAALPLVGRWTPEVAADQASPPPGTPFRTAIEAPEPADLPAPRRPADLSGAIAARRGPEPTAHPEPADPPAPPPSRQSEAVPAAARRPDAAAELRSALRPDTEPDLPPLPDISVFSAPAATPQPGRPADLGDHLRVRQRPADLAQYSELATGRTTPASTPMPTVSPATPARRPASLDDYTPGWRPATLADQPLPPPRGVDQPAPPHPHEDSPPPPGHGEPESNEPS